MNNVNEVSGMSGMSGMKGSIDSVVTLDLCGRGVTARVCARQGEALVHRIRVILTRGGRKYVPSGVVIARFTGLLPDGSTVGTDGRILGGGEFEFEPGSGFFAVGGPVLVRLTLRGDDGAELCTPAFAIDADPSFTAGADAPDSEEYSRIEELLLQTLEARRAIDETAEEIRCGDYSTPLSDEAPLANGEAFAGTSDEAARADHVHPRDAEYMKSLSNKTNIATGDSIPFYSSADKAEYKILFGRLSVLLRNTIPAESWTFTLADGTTVTKEVCVK